jgi:hypothetical protein
MIKFLGYTSVLLMVVLNLQNRHTPILNTYALSLSYKNRKLDDQKKRLEPNQILYSSKLRGKPVQMILDSLETNFHWIQINIEDLEFNTMAVLEFIPSQSDTLRYYLNLDHTYLYSEKHSMRAELGRGKNHEMILGQFPSHAMLTLGLGIEK